MDKISELSQIYIDILDMILTLYHNLNTNINYKFYQSYICQHI